MYAFLLVLHLVICLGLICVILVQSGKGGGLAGGAFGGSAQTVFGGRGATDFFTKATMVLGVAFFMTSLTLALMSSGQIGGQRSLIQGEARRSSSTAPAPAPGAMPPAGQQPLTPAAPAPGSTPATSTPTPAGPPPPPPGSGGR